jgi:hypothetical protein
MHNMEPIPQVVHGSAWVLLPMYNCAASAVAVNCSEGDYILCQSCGCEATPTN